MKSRKKDINKTQHNTKYTHTHTSLCQELAQVPLMSKFSNLLEARCLIDSIQWASSSPRPAKAGRQAGRQHVLYPRSNTQGSFQVLCMIFFSFWLICRHLEGSDFYFQTFIFFFSTKIGNFLGRNFFFPSFNLT